MEENSSFHNEEGLIDGINKDEEVVDENNNDIVNSKEKLQMDQAMDVANDNENEIYHQEEDTERNNYSIPDIDKMEIDHATENDNQNVPDVDYNQQERPNSHSSNRSSIRQNSGDIQSTRVKSGGSNRNSIRELYTASSKNSLLPTTFSNSSLNKKNINNTDSPIDLDKHSSQYLTSPNELLNSRGSLKFSGTSSSKSRLHSETSTKNQYGSTLTSSNGEFDDLKSVMSFGSKISEISLLSESMAKEQILKDF